MIKDKISPGLKDAFSENIEKTLETGKEHGFYICADKEGKLTPSRVRCIGSQCSIVAERLPDMCPEKIQGFFHTHPQRSLLEKIIDRKLTKEDMRILTEQGKKLAKEKGLTAQTPSHRDVLVFFISKCDNFSEGTVCIAGDMEPDKVGCWTPKKGAVNRLTCSYAKHDSKAKDKFGIGPKRWIKPLFDKEVINLERSYRLKEKYGNL